MGRKKKAKKAPEAEEMSITKRISGENAAKVEDVLKDFPQGRSVKEVAAEAKLTALTAACHLLKLAVAGRLEQAEGTRAVRYKLRS